MPHFPAAEDLLRRFTDLENNRHTFENQWQEIADHMLGRRQFTTRDEIPGRKRMQRIYDTTAVNSVERLSAALHSLLTNTESRWFGITLEDFDRAKHPDAMFWLENATMRMRTEFERPDAGFTPQVHEMYYDLVALGTGVMFVEDLPGSGARFSSRPLAEIFLSENSAGRVDTVYRQFRLTHRQAMELWPNNPPREAAKMVEKKPEARADYLHSVFPNPVFIPGNLDASGKPFASVYLDKKDKDFIGDVGGFEEMPFLTPRWNKDSGEVHGRGPGVVALADAKMLNEISRTTLKGAMKAVDPPMYIPNDGISSNLNNMPGGVSTFDQNYLLQSRGQPVMFAPQAANVGLGVEMEERRANSIRRAFHHELLQMFEDPRMTATQVLELSRTAQRLLSPVLGRQRVEFLEPMLERVFGIMFRAGKFLPVPEVLQGQRIKIDYVSPVSRAQKADEANAVTRVLAQAVELSSVSEGVLDNFNIDEAIRFVAQQNQVPIRLMNDPRIVQQIREQRAAEQARQQQLALAMEAAKVAPPLISAEAQLQEAQAA